MKDLTRTQKDALVHRTQRNVLLMRAIVEDMVMVRYMSPKPLNRHVSELALLKNMAHGTPIEDVEQMILSHVDREAWLENIVGAYRRDRIRKQLPKSTIDIEWLPRDASPDELELAEWTKAVFGDIDSGM